MEIICDKCGSNNTEQFSKDKPEIKRMTMKELIRDKDKMNVVPAIYKYTNMALLCRDCGYRVEYQV